MESDENFRRFGNFGTPIAISSIVQETANKNNAKDRIMSIAQLLEEVKSMDHMELGSALINLVDTIDEGGLKDAQVGEARRQADRLRTILEFILNH
jgi:hypothetical protein